MGGGGGGGGRDGMGGGEATAKFKEVVELGEDVRVSPD